MKDKYVKNSRSQQIRVQRFKILLSGVMDDDYFNNEVRRIRKKLDLPEEGLVDADLSSSLKWHQELSKKSDHLMATKEWKDRVHALDSSDEEYEKKLRDLHKEVPLNFLTYSIEDILEEYPDLDSSFKKTIKDYILFGEFQVTGGFTVTSSYKGDQHECVVRFTEIPTRDDMMKIHKQVKSLLSYRNKTLLDDIDFDLDVLKHSKRKGEKIKSHKPGEEYDGEINDDWIANQVLSPKQVEEEPKKALELIRKRRQRGMEAIEKLFPITLGRLRARDSKR